MRAELSGASAPFRDSIIGQVLLPRRLRPARSKSGEAALGARWAAPARQK